MPSSFDLRLVRYVPQGARVGTVPDLGINLTSGADGGTVTFRTSKLIHADLPELMEVAVEYYGPLGWTEGEDSRFFVTTKDYDDRDPSGVVSMTGYSLVGYLLTDNTLYGVEPYVYTGAVTYGAKTLANCTTSGSTFTKANHGLKNGDRVEIEDRGKISTKKKIRQGGTYWVQNVTTNTFRLSGSATGGDIEVGTATEVDVRRLRDRFEAPGHQFKKHEAVRLSQIDDNNIENHKVYYIQMNYANVATDPDTFQIAPEPGKPGIEIEAFETANVYRHMDGDRVFKNRSPGSIMKQVIDEAQARGWGAGLSYDFSITTDSAGEPWAQKVVDEEGLPVGFKPGTTAAQILSFLQDQGLVEIKTDKRKLRLFNAPYGFNLGVGNTPVRVGANATELPVKENLNELATAMTIRGEGRVFVQKDRADLPGLGRLEGWRTASGVWSFGAANHLADRALDGSVAAKQYSVSEEVASAAAVPLVNYLRGDAVKVTIGGTDQVLRVAEFVFEKTSTRRINTTAVLNSSITDLIIRLKRKVDRISGGTAGGTGMPVVEKDTRMPAAPTSVVVESVGVFGEDDRAASNIVTSWQPVVADLDGYSIQVARYEVLVRADGDQDFTATPTTGLNAVTGTYPVGALYYVSVRAVSTAGVVGEPSDEVEITTALPLLPPDPPSAPTVTSDKGVVTVHWDGFLVDPDLGPEPPDAGFDHVYVTRSDTELGTYLPVGNNLGTSGVAVDATVIVGNTYWYKLYAVTTVGVVSPPSPAVSHTVAGIDLGSLEDDLAAMIESTGANPVIGSATPGVDKQLADVVWFDTTVADAVVPKRWDGSAWVAIPYGAGALGPNSVVATSIAANAITAGKIASNAVTADKIEALAVTAGKLAADSVTATKIAAGSVEANKIAVGAIQAQHISLGARVATPTNRVLAPLTDSAYWSQVIAGTVVLGGSGVASGVTAGSTGITMPAGGGVSKAFPLTQRLAVPITGKVVTTALNLSATTVGLVVAFGTESTFVGSYVTYAQQQEFVIPAGSTHYWVYLYVPTTGTGGLVPMVSVFEVIGAGVGQQGAELGPHGLRLRSDDGSTMVDFTTASDNVLSIWKNTGVGLEAQATINSDGDAVFNNVSVNEDFSARGLALMGTDYPAIKRNGADDTVPLLQRFSVGGTRMGYFDMWEGTTSIAFRSLAYASFEFVAGRQYRLTIDAPVRVRNTGASVAALEVVVSSAPMAVNVTSGTSTVQLLNSQILSASNTYHSPFNLSRALRTYPGVFSDISLAEGTNYIMIRTRNPNLVGLEFTRQVTRGTLLVEDVGPSFGEIDDITSDITSGTPPTPAVRKTEEWTATWGRSWAGSSVVSGGHSSSQGVDQYMLYQGATSGGTSMASAFGFPALGLSGKTITAVQLGMQNRSLWAAVGGQALLGTHGNSTVPATRPASRVNSFDIPWSRTDGKWEDVPDTLWAGIASGTIRGFTLGISSTSTAEYGAFDGVGESLPPKLRVTYK